MTTNTSIALIHPEIVETVSGTPLALSSNYSGASSDHQIIALWLNGCRSLHTRRAYATDAARFLEAIQKPLGLVTLTDLQAFASNLGGVPKSQARTIAAVKSLLSFGQRTGYLRFNAGSAFKLPAYKDTLAERILTEEEAFRLITAAPKGRDKTIIRLIYATGIRVAEICALSWCDLQPREKSGQITVYGKGGITRSVLLPNKGTLWADLTAMRGSASDDTPVFLSRTGKRLNTLAVLRVVKKAAKLAGIPRAVSPHWFRHSHASHAIERGAPIHLVQATLGHASMATTGRYMHARPSESSSRFLLAV